MRWIYLSPHLDDAVLSCGGLIYEQAKQGTPVAIWTLMAGYPRNPHLSALAVRIHAEWGTGGAWRTVFARRQEDRRAARLVGAQVRHFDFLDMIYRRSKTGETLYPDDIFVDRHPADRDFPEQLAMALSSTLRLDDILVCPLAIGGHLDHVLVREAAEKLRRPLWYYADVPYVLQQPQALMPAARGLISVLFPIFQESLEVWIAGILTYASQISSLFGDARNVQEAIRSYWAFENGLRLWRVD